MYDSNRFSTVHSPEYQAYQEALAQLASKFVSRIRIQYAMKAYEMYQNPTVRKLVLAYGEDYKKLKQSWVHDFEFVAVHGIYEWTSMEDDCLSNAGAYAKAIELLFDINHDEKYWPEVPEENKEKN